MRLGIVAVYLVTPGNERLLDLHLEYVERTTSVPYTIFAAAPRLEPGLRERLAAAPRVTIVEMPASELRGPEEHACYLERLVAAALADGVSHVVTLHVDSFPIRRGWETEMAARLDDRCPFAAVVRDDEVDRKPCTAFIFAESAFLAAHRPTFLLPAAILESAEFARYARRFRALRDSGIGYGFAAWRAKPALARPVPQQPRRGSLSLRQRLRRPRLPPRRRVLGAEGLPRQRPPARRLAPAAARRRRRARGAARGRGPPRQEGGGAAAAAARQRAPLRGQRA